MCSNTLSNPVIAPKTRAPQSQDSAKVDKTTVLPPCVWSDDDVHHLINISEEKYSQFRKKNITAYAKDIRPELLRLISFDLTWEAFPVRQIEEKLRYMKNRYEFIYSKISGTGFGLEEGDSSRSIVERANVMLPYFSKLKEFIGRPWVVQPMACFHKFSGLDVTET